MFLGLPLLPPLIVPDTEAEQKSWAIQIIKAIAMSQYIAPNYETIQEKLALNGTFDAARFDSLLRIVAAEIETTTDAPITLPAVARNLNIIGTMVRKQIAELLASGVTYTTYVNDSAHIEEKFDEFSAIVDKKVGRKLRQMAGVEQSIGQPLYEEDIIQESDEQVFGLTFDKHKMEWEELFQAFLSFFQTDKNINFDYKTKQQFYRSYLAHNKCAVEQYYDGHRPNVRNIDMTFFGCIPIEDSPFIHEFPIAWEYTWWTLDQIIQNVPGLSNAQIQELKDVSAMYMGISSTTTQGWRYSDAQAEQVMAGWKGFVAPLVGEAYTNGVKFLVTNVWWKADKPTRQISIKDDYADITFSADAKKNIEKVKRENDGKEVEDKIKYDKAIFKATGIGSVLSNFVNISEEIKSNPDAPDQKHIPVYGLWFNEPSYVRNVMPFVEVIIILLRQIEILSQQPSGNKLVFDKSAGGDFMKNVYNLYANSVIEMDSSAVGASPNSGQNIRVLDFKVSDAISQLSNTIGLMMNFIYMVSGENSSSFGQAKDYINTGVVAQQIQQSNMATMEYRENFYKCMEYILQAMCNQIPEKWKGRNNEKLWYLSNENRRMFMELNMPENATDCPYMAVQITHSASDAAMKQQLLGLVGQSIAVNKDERTILDYYRMAMQPTAKLAVAIFEEGVKQREKERQQMMAAQQLQQQEAMQAQVAGKQAAVNTQAAAEIEKAKINTRGALEKEAMRNNNDRVLNQADKINQLDIMTAQSSIDNSKMAQ